MAHLDPKDYQRFGSAILQRVQQIDQLRAGKITGMLLERPVAELMQFRDDPADLAEAVRYAQLVLDAAAAAERFRLALRPIRQHGSITLRDSDGQITQEAQEYHQAFQESLKIGLALTVYEKQSRARG